MQRNCHDGSALPWNRSKTERATHCRKKGASLSVAVWTGEVVTWECGMGVASASVTIQIPHTYPLVCKPFTYWVTEGPQLMDLASHSSVKMKQLHRHHINGAQDSFPLPIPFRSPVQNPFTGALQGVLGQEMIWPNDTSSLLSFSSF